MDEGKRGEFRAKKKWGQNFLHDENVLKKIVEFIGPQPDDTFLEIGPGTGELTKRILPRVKRLIAVEIDPQLIPALQELTGLDVVHEDILRFDIAKIAKDQKIRVAGNLPYYISTPVLTHLISHRDLLLDLTLMFQEEVAQRILAQPSTHEYGLLSVLCQYFTEIEKGFLISRNSFRPRPEIESRILKFRFRQNTQIPYDHYFQFLAGAFAQRRKKLRNNLLTQLKLEADRVDEAFDQLHISENARAENLSPTQFDALIRELR